MGVMRHRPLTAGQQLRKLQLAVDHIAAVLQDVSGDGVADLNDALDSIHQAEASIEDEHDDG